MVLITVLSRSNDISVSYVAFICGEAVARGLDIFLPCRRLCVSGRVMQTRTQVLLLHVVYRIIMQRQ
jgi:hypothetical protein